MSVTVTYRERGVKTEDIRLISSELVSSETVMMFVYSIKPLNNLHKYSRGVQFYYTFAPVLI